MRAILTQGQVDPVVKHIALSTQSLLRDTMALDEDQWRAPSLVPGWSRAHVATHLSRNADALRRLVAAARTGDTTRMYPDEAAKFNDLERGAERSPMELYVDLDTSAGELVRLADRVEDWTVPITLAGGTFPLSAIPLIRLHEVTMHHLDLDCGFGWRDMDLLPAHWLLQWMLLLLDDDLALPAVDIASDAGTTASLGGVGERRTASGPDAALWAWLVGRTDGDGVTGTDGIRWPLAG